MIGHLLGAAGGVEAVATVQVKTSNHLCSSSVFNTKYILKIYLSWMQAIRTGWVHPNINLENPDTGVVCLLQQPFTKITLWHYLLYNYLIWWNEKQRMPKCLLGQRKREWISRQPYQIHLVLGVTILQSYLHPSSETDFIGNYFVIYHKVRFISEVMFFVVTVVQS